MASSAAAGSIPRPTTGSLAWNRLSAKVHDPSSAGVPTDSVSSVDGRLQRRLVDDDHGVEVLAAGVVVPEAPGAPRLLAAGSGDRGGVVDRQPGVLGQDRLGLVVDGHRDRLVDPVGEAALERLGRGLLLATADVDAGDGGAARHLVAGHEIGGGPARGEQQHQAHDDQQDQPAALALGALGRCRGGALEHAHRGILGRPGVGWSICNTGARRGQGREARDHEHRPRIPAAHSRSRLRRSRSRPRPSAPPARRPPPPSRARTGAGPPIRWGRRTRSGRWSPARAGAPTRWSGRPPRRVRPRGRRPAGPRRGRRAARGVRCRRRGRSRDPRR